MGGFPVLSRLPSRWLRLDRLNEPGRHLVGQPDLLIATVKAHTVAMCFLRSDSQEHGRWVFAAPDRHGGLSVYGEIEPREHTCAPLLRDAPKPVVYRLPNRLDPSVKACGG